MSTQDSMVPLARISRKQNSKNRLAETSCIGALSAILLKVLVYGGAMTQHHKLGGLKQQKGAVSQLWKLGVCSEGVGRPCSLRNLEGSPSYPFSASGSLLALFAVLYLSATSLHSLPLSSHAPHCPVYVPVSLNVPLPVRAPVTSD